MNSPMEIHIKGQEEFFQDISIIPNGGSAQEQNHFQDLSMGENVTRTGKRTDDLDESDARAIGIPGHVTVSELPTVVDEILGTVVEEISTSKGPVHASKNLSFHWQTTVQ